MSECDYSHLRSPIRVIVFYVRYDIMYITTGHNNVNRNTTGDMMNTKRTIKQRVALVVLMVLSLVSLVGCEKHDGTLVSDGNAINELLFGGD